MADSVKTVALRDVSAIFSTSDMAEQKKLEDKLKDDIKQSLTSLTESPRPTGNDTIGKLYDGAAALESGTKSFSSSLDTDYSAVGQTLFVMIRNEPASKNLLAGYQTELAQAQADSVAPSGGNQAQLKQQTESQTNGNLISAGSELARAGAKIQSGSTQLKNGIGMAGQAVVVQDIMNKATVDENEQFTRAFSKVFLLSAIILALTSVCGLFTDKKKQSKGSMSRLSFLSGRSSLSTCRATATSRCTNACGTVDTNDKMRTSGDKTLVAHGKNPGA